MSQKRPKPIVLLILDGLGVDMPTPGNAVRLANTPNLDALWPKHPHTSLQASENYVGLPKGVKGNSEVGHMSIGAGRIILQEITKIDHHISTGEFFNNQEMMKAINHAKEHQSKIHFMGVVSDGRVHASQEHLYACMEFAAKQGIPAHNVVIHVFTDGRDTAPQSADEYLSDLESKIKSIGVGVIGSVIGRYYAMDRDERWERTQKTYEMLVDGKGSAVANWREAIKRSYAQNINDEYIEPFVIVDESKEPVGKISSNDTVIFFNYRADRAVQLSQVFDLEGFDKFERTLPNNIYFAGFSNYQKGIPMYRSNRDVEEHGGESQMVKALLEEEIANRALDSFPRRQIFPPEDIDESLGEVISKQKLKQLRLTESEKYPHVTYFLNCRRNEPFEGEERVEIPSPKEVKTYDQKPEMSTYEITSKLIENLQKKDHDFILINFALTDMVAHTGNLDASIKAVEVADECLGKVVEAVLGKGGEIVITADHGNIEELINLQTNEPDTEHSLNPVPFLYVSNKENPVEIPMGFLADLAPTILALLGIQKPPSMTGRNLLEGLIDR